MRSYIVLALLAVASAATYSQNERAFEDTIINFLECLRGEMETGWPDFGIPNLNPLDVEDLTLDLTGVGLAGLGGELNVHNLHVEGVTGFEYANIKGSIGLIPPSYTIEMDLSFPKLVLNTEYSGTVQIDALELDTFGAGELIMDANNVAANLGLKATILGGLKVEYCDIWISMDPLTDFKITGVRNDEDYSQQITDDILANGHNSLGDLAPTLHDMLERAIMSLINDGDLGEEGGFLSGIIDRCL